jgi:hypothetical protein
MVIAVDMDGILCEEGDWGKHSESFPIKKNIEQVNRLYDGGNQIIIYTGRFHDEYQLTLDWLRKYDVKFHQLVMNKLLADVYVDDRMKTLEELCCSEDRWVPITL